MAVLSKERVFKQIADELREQIAATEKAVEQAREAFHVGDDRAENRGERGAIQVRAAGVWRQRVCALADRHGDVATTRLRRLKCHATGLCNSPMGSIVIRTSSPGFK